MLVHLQALQVAGQVLDLQVVLAEEVQVQVRLEVWVVAVLGLAPLGVLALGVLVLVLQTHPSLPSLVKCSSFKYECKQ